MSSFYPVKFVQKTGGFFTGTNILKYITEQNFGGAYTIRIEPDKCEITADRDGIFYAEDVLKEFNGKVPCGIISEKPDVSIRCFHIDMKKGIGSLAELKKTIIRLRELRINYILAEYENRIRYNCAPDIAEFDALSQDEVREFVQFAEDNGIHVIPLLQCLGHMEYLLSIEKYRHLSETPDTVTQYCPLNEDSLNLFKQMAEELLALHPNAEYFHVGADEARQLGKCQKCEEFVRKHSISELFFQRLNSVCCWFDERGKKTLFWHDMLCHANRYDLIEKLPESAMPMYWSYAGNDEHSSRFFLDGDEGVTISGKWMDKVHSFADFEEAPKAFSHVNWDLPLRGIAFNGVEKLCKIRKEVWGASAAIRFGMFPNELIVRENISAWCETVKKFNMRGVVITCWASYDSHAIASGPRSLNHYSMAIEGMKLWDNSLTIEEIRARYDAYFGCSGLSRILNIMVFSKPHETFCNWAEYGGDLMDGLKPTENIDLFEKYHAAVSAEKLFRQVDSFLKWSAIKMFSSVESAKARTRSTLEEYRKKLLVNRIECGKHFSDEFSEQILREWLDSHYGPRLLAIDAYLRFKGNFSEEK